MSFEASDVDPTMCTHLLYSFAGLTEETLEIVSLDPERDIVSGRTYSFTLMPTCRETCRQIHS